MPDTGALERIKCHCGLTMLTAPGGARFCENCDRVQIKESIGLQRARTPEDVRFDLYWMNQMNKDYDPLPPDVDTKDLTGEG